MNGNFQVRLEENLKTGRSAALLRDVRRGIWRAGRGAVTGVIFFIGYQWLLGATAKKKCIHRNEKHEKNLHTRFLPMHRIGSSGKLQVANDEIHVCFWSAPPGE